MEVVAGILAVLLLLWVCSGSSRSNSEPRDLHIGRNADGSYYIYDRATGDVIGTFSDRATAQEHLRDLK